MRSRDAAGQRVAALVRESAGWLLLARLFECPTERWRREVTALAGEFDDPALQAVIEGLGFLVVQELYLTATAERADVVFPAQSFIEREGTFTSGEGRVQRFYPAVPAQGETRPDWWMVASLGARLNGSTAPASAAACMDEIARDVPAYAGISYQALSEVREQWPLVGGGDLYFGGTAYANRQGLGVKLSSDVELGAPAEMPWPEPPVRPTGAGLLLIPVYRLYDRGTTLLPSTLLEPHRAARQIELNPMDARALGASDGSRLEIEWDGRVESCSAAVSEQVPAGAALVPRSSGLSLLTPTRARLRLAASGAGP